LEDSDVVINLAGRSVNCRYGARNRREIMKSRVNSTKVLGEAIAKANRPPRIWLQASTGTIYEHRFDAPHDDVTGILGGQESDALDTWRFSIEVVGHDIVDPYTD
jgi:NAD dependent epimerase/dehydratase family enzyme